MLPFGGDNQTEVVMKYEVEMEKVEAGDGDRALAEAERRLKAGEVDFPESDRHKEVSKRALRAEPQV